MGTAASFWLSGGRRPVWWCSGGLRGGPQELARNGLAQAPAFGLLAAMMPAAEQAVAKRRQRGNAARVSSIVEAAGGNRHVASPNPAWRFTAPGLAAHMIQPRGAAA